MDKSVELEHSPCPLGCVHADEPILTGRDYLHDLPGEFSVVKCLTCGLMRTDPRPTPDTIGFYYPDDYSPYVGSRVRSGDRTGRSESALKAMLKQVIRLNTQSLPSIRPGRLLEIGCASGSFMHKMAHQGWGVTGIEFDQKAAESARALGYPVFAGSMETAPEPDSCYDLVVGWMVLEHLHDPVRALERLRQWVSPKGWLVISIPNAGSLEFSLFKDKWYALQLPTHLYHFTPATARALLKSAGWSIQEILHQRVLTNSIVSAGYCLRGSKGLSAIGESLEAFPKLGIPGNVLLYPLALFLSLFGQTGRMTIWARRDG